MGQAKPESEKDILSPNRRAEDVLLGSLGYGEEARIVSVEKMEGGYRGVGKWPDGETFKFESDSELDGLQVWALELLIKGLA